VVSNLYDVVLEKSGQVNNLVTNSNEYGAWSQYFNGVDVTFNVRVGKDFTFVGGTSTGQTVADNCKVRAHLPELATTTTGTSAFGAGLATSSRQDSEVRPLTNADRARYLQLAELECGAEVNF
jgi:hypothetical protein